MNAAAIRRLVADAATNPDIEKVNKLIAPGGNLLSGLRRVSLQQ
jgi:hypothetical protein